MGRSWLARLEAVAVDSRWVYPVLAIIGIVGSSIVWNRLLRDRPQAQDQRLVYVYLAALAGAFLGAKAAYLFSEGWIVWQHYAADPSLAWQQWLTGKSITGALLGGYGAVELAKKLSGYNKPTGDLFAVIVPLGLVLGRVGCLFSGCCPGVPMEPFWYTLVDHAGVARWPAVPVELAFNATMALVSGVCWRRGWLHGQVFHVYLIAYGAFRFFHEFIRDTPGLLGPLSGYQLLALGILGLGVVRFVQRERVSRRLGVLA